MRATLSGMLGLFSIVLSNFETANPSYAKDPLQAQEYARKVFFHVSLTGKLLDGPQADRQGKAFAISEDTLLTARHVVGDRREFANRGLVDGGVYIPHRSVVLHWMDGYHAGDKVLEEDNLFIRSSATDTVDASRLKVPNMDMDGGRIFLLNGCSIDDQELYRVLVVSNNPTDYHSVKSPILMDMKSTDYNSTTYGELYVFRLASPERLLQKGDSGSPVVDSNGHVVGIVTGFFMEHDQQNILVTLVESFMELIPPTLSVKCLRPSNIHDELNNHIDDTTNKLTEINNRIDSLAPKITWSLRFKDDKVLEIRADKVLDSTELHVEAIYVEGAFQYKTVAGTLRAKNFEGTVTPKIAESAVNIFDFPIDEHITNQRKEISESQGTSFNNISIRITPKFTGESEPSFQDPLRSRFFVLDWIFHE